MPLSQELERLIEQAKQKLDPSLLRKLNASQIKENGLYRLSAPDTPELHKIKKYLNMVMQVDSLKEAVSLDNVVAFFKNVEMFSEGWLANAKHARPEAVLERGMLELTSVLTQLETKRSQTLATLFDPETWKAGKAKFESLQAQFTKELEASPVVELKRLVKSIQAIKKNLELLDADKLKAGGIFDKKKQVANLVALHKNLVQCLDQLDKIDENHLTPKMQEMIKTLVDMNPLPVDLRTLFQKSTEALFSQPLDLKELSEKFKAAVMKMPGYKDNPVIAEAFSADKMTKSGKYLIDEEDPPLIQKTKILLNNLIKLEKMAEIYPTLIASQVAQRATKETIKNPHLASLTERLKNRMAHWSLKKQELESLVQMGRIANQVHESLSEINLQDVLFKEFGPVAATQLKEQLLKYDKQMTRLYEEVKDLGKGAERSGEGAFQAVTAWFLKQYHTLHERLGISIEDQVITVLPRERQSESPSQGMFLNALQWDDPCSVALQVIQLRRDELDAREGTHRSTKHKELDKLEQKIEAFFKDNDQLSLEEAEELMNDYAIGASSAGQLKVAEDILVAWENIRQFNERPDLSRTRTNSRSSEQDHHDVGSSPEVSPTGKNERMFDSQSWEDDGEAQLNWDGSEEERSVIDDSEEEVSNEEWAALLRERDRYSPPSVEEVSELENYVTLHQEEEERGQYLPKKP